MIVVRVLTEKLKLDLSNKHREPSMEKENTLRESFGVGSPGDFAASSTLYFSLLAYIFG